MDIKLKNNENETEKRAKQERLPGILVVAVLILATSFAFLSQYPKFKEQATEEEPNILVSNEFLHEIYQANIVLYKQFCDFAANGEQVSAQDVFLSAQIGKAEQFSEYYNFGLETPLSFAGEQLDELLDQWNQGASGISEEKCGKIRFFAVGYKVYRDSRSQGGNRHGGKGDVSDS